MQTICYSITEWGAGQAFDWSVLGGIDREFFLAGGLQADNLAEAMETVRPYAVDISSGIESDRKKDPEKMHRIMELVERYRNKPQASKSGGF